jgi:hypothetical protein
MKIELITMWYNEEDFAPFFLNHFSWVDNIHLIIDADTNDNTVEIAKKYPNVTIEYFQFPDMMDDVLKVNKLNDTYRGKDADWVIIVDSDEFIFNSDLGNDFRNELEASSEQVIFARLWNVYKHTSESNLDMSIQISQQRKYGILDMKGQTACYTKPSIIRGRQDAFLAVGNHSVNINGTKATSKQILEGSHWAMADEELAVKRRIYGRKLRQSQVNLTTGLTIQNHKITEEEIRNECGEMNNCPQVLFPK